MAERPNRRQRLGRALDDLGDRFESSMKPWLWITAVMVGVAVWWLIDILVNGVPPQPYDGK